jgi:hypothetical protein
MSAISSEHCDEANLEDPMHPFTHTKTNGDLKTGRITFEIAALLTVVGLATYQATGADKTEGAAAPCLESRSFRATETETDFGGGNPAPAAKHEACFGCHVPAKEHGYIFTRYAP